MSSGVVSWSVRSETPHPNAGCDEWVFAAWTPDGDLGVVSGHRLIGGRAWYWFALVETGHPLLTVTEWDVRVRSDPFTVKAPEMWAEHHCVAPMEQWTIGNEAHAVALDDADEALGRAYGTPTPMATDLEWYATEPPSDCSANDSTTLPGWCGYRQDGVVHGLIELLDRPHIEVTEIPARRWRRWTRPEHPDLGPVPLDEVLAHTGLRAPFAFPDQTVADWVLTPDGWRSRPQRRPGRVRSTPQGH